MRLPLINVSLLCISADALCTDTLQLPSLPRSALDRDLETLLRAFTIKEREPCLMAPVLALELLATHFM